MKKISAAALCIAFMLVLCACTVTITTGSDPAPTPTPTPIIVYVTVEPSPTPTPTPTPTVEPTPTPAPAPDKISAGDVITFGRYEQDNAKTNGAEDIEWIVLDAKSDSLTLISRYILDKRCFDSDKWERSPLRQWLNGDFYKEAFSAEEAARILTTTVTADWNPSSMVDPGKDTKDKVFLLSINEAAAYFDGGDVGCEPTEYALAQGVYCKFDICGNWWLRTPGNCAGFMSYVTHDPEISTYGVASTSGGVGVRPVIRISP